MIPEMMSLRCQASKAFHPKSLGFLASQESWLHFAVCSWSCKNGILRLIERNRPNPVTGPDLDLIFKF